MTKRLKNLEIMLGVGTTFIFFAGIGLLSTDLLSNNILKVLSSSIIAITLLLLSEVSERNFKLKGVGIYTYVLFFISTIETFFGAGNYKLIGDEFYLAGELGNVFFACILILIGLLFILTKVKYKNDKMIYYSYISFIAAIFFILAQVDEKMYLPLIVTDIIFVALNLIKTKKSFRPFVVISTFIYAGLSAFVVLTNDLYLIASSMILNLVSLLYISKTTKNIGYKLASLFVILFNLLLAIIYTFINFDGITALVINTCIICLLDMIIGFGKFITTKPARWIYKSILNVLLMIILLVSFSQDITIMVLPIFIVGSSLVESFIIKGDDEEKYYFPPKLILSITLLIKILSDMYFVLEFTSILLIINVISLMFYILAKEPAIKKEYLGIIMISFIILAFGGSIFSFTTYIFSLAIVALDYFALENMGKNNKNDPISKIFYAFMLVYFLISTIRIDYSNIKYLILSIVLLALFILTYERKDRFKTGITLPALMFSLVAFIMGLSAPEWLIISASHVLVQISIILFSNLVFKDEKSKETFMCIAFIFTLLYLLFHSIEVLAVVGLIESLMILLYDLRDGYRNSYFYVGVVFACAFGIRLLTNFDLPSIVYLLVIGIVIIGSVIYMIIRYQKKDYQKDLKMEEERKNPKYKNNYCPECGTKLETNAKFCYKCGRRI